MSTKNSKRWNDLTPEEKKKIALKNPFSRRKKEQEKNVEKQNINVDNYTKEEDKKENTGQIEQNKNNFGPNFNTNTGKDSKQIK